MAKLTYPNFPVALAFDDVLLVPQYSDIKARSEVDLTTKIAPDITLKTPLISVNMDTITGIKMALAMDKNGGIGYIGRFDPPNIQADKIAKIKSKGGRSIGVIGIKDNYIERAEKILKAGSIALHLDIAHAHSLYAIEAIKECKKRFPKISMIAGTIATYEGAYALFEAGADSIKVGIGGGTTCITRIMTGSGVPQITAILEADRARKKFKNRFLIGDAGAENSGDIVKVLAAGADAYQGGNIFAGSEETPGKVIEKNGILYKEYNGSTSPNEKKRQLEKDKRNKDHSYVLHVEGVNTLVRYKGPVKDVLNSLCAGIRSGLSYSGARNIKELHQKAKFIQITSAGVKESRPHNVEVV
jgi:IMP dehydrogenase